MELRAYKTVLSVRRWLQTGGRGSGINSGTRRQVVWRQRQVKPRATCKVSGYHSGDIWSSDLLGYDTVPLGDPVVFRFSIKRSNKDGMYYQIAWLGQWRYLSKGRISLSQRHSITVLKTSDFSSLLPHQWELKAQLSLCLIKHHVIKEYEEVEI